MEWPRPSLDATRSLRFGLAILLAKQISLGATTKFIEVLLFCICIVSCSAVVENNPKHIDPWVNKNNKNARNLKNISLFDIEESMEKIESNQNINFLDLAKTDFLGEWHLFDRIISSTGSIIKISTATKNKSDFIFESNSSQKHFLCLRSFENTPSKIILNMPICDAERDGFLSPRFYRVFYAINYLGEVCLISSYETNQIMEEVKSLNKKGGSVNLSEVKNLTSHLYFKKNSPQYIKLKNTFGVLPVKANKP